MANKFESELDKKLQEAQNKKKNSGTYKYNDMAQASQDYYNRQMANTEIDLHSMPGWDESQKEWEKRWGNTSTPPRDVPAQLNNIRTNRNNVAQTYTVDNPRRASYSPEYAANLTEQLNNISTGKKRQGTLSVHHEDLGDKFRNAGVLAKNFLAGMAEGTGGVDIANRMFKTTEEKNLAKVPKEFRATIKKDLERPLSKSDVFKELKPIQGTTAEKVTGGAGYMAGMLLPGGAASEAVKVIPIIGKAPGTLAALNRAGMGFGLYEGATSAIEGNSAAEIAKDTGKGYLMGVGTEAGLGLLGKAIKAGRAAYLAKGAKARKASAIADEDIKIPGTEAEAPAEIVPENLPGSVSPEYAKELAGRVQRQTLPTPKAEPTPETYSYEGMKAPERLALPEGKASIFATVEETAIRRNEAPKPLALPVTQEAKALNPGREADFHVDQYGVARTEPGTPLALPEGNLNKTSVFTSTDEAPATRSDIGDPVYIEGLKAKYNDMVKAEVARMKDEINGVQILGDSDNGYRRESLNPSWYREFYAKNKRLPREGELRDIAVNNLIKGNPGSDMPANEEFLSVASEILRGQELPEQWHATQRSIREWENDPELEGLVKEAQQSQAEVEPYGVIRDIGRLTDTENAFRNKTGQVDPADFGEYEAVNFKASREPAIPDEVQEQTAKDIKALRDVMGIDKSTGQNKAILAPEAIEKPEYKAASDIANKLGLRLVTYKGTEIRGFQAGRNIYINSELQDPVNYVFWHETAHTMQTTHPELYEKLMDITIEHAGDDAAIIKHYREVAYEDNKIPHEFTADVFAEVLTSPGFFSRLGHKAPELIKPILDVIDRVISRITSKVHKDDTVLPWIKDIATMRERIRQEITEPYFQATAGEKELPQAFGEKWRTAAKSPRQAEQPKFKVAKEDPAAKELRQVVEYGAAQLVRSQGKAEHWAEQMKKRFPERFTGNDAQVDAKTKFWLNRATEYRNNGETSVEYKGEVVPIRKATTTATMAEMAGKEVNTTTPDKEWNHVVSKTKRQWQGLKQTVKNAANSGYREVIDDLYRLNQLDKKGQLVNLNKNVSGEDRAYLLALNARESEGTAKTILTDAMYNHKGDKIGDSLASITQKIPKGKELDFANYLIYRHAPTWLEQGRSVFPKEKGITADISRQRAATYEQLNPEFKELGSDLVQWQRDFGKAWLVDTGVIKPEDWKTMQDQYPDYIPFQRSMEDIEVGGQGAKRGYANQSNPIKKAEGSQRPIIDPIESIIEHVDKYIKVARRNEVMQAVYRNARQDPEAMKDWIELLPEKGETFESAYTKEGLDGFIEWMDEPYEALHNRKNQNYGKTNVVRAMVNGEPVHFEVKDTALLDAITNLTPKAANAVIEGVRQFTRTMKVLTTGANVFFATRNIVRDLPMSYVQSKTTNNPVTWAWGIIDSFARIATGGKYDPGKYYQTYKALGGGSHSSSIAADRNLLAESKAAIMPGYYDIGKPVTTAIRGVKTAGRGIEQFTNAVETMPRLPEYIRTVKKGGNTYGARMEGLNAAQDVTVNFSKRGGEALHTLDAGIPYLNAALQGMDKLARTFKENPIQAATKAIVAISVPTILMYMVNHDDPQYKKLSPWIRDTYYCIPKGDGKFIKIPKPREAGVVFGSLVERCLAKWADDDPEGFRGFKEAWVNNFVPPVRTIFAPVNDIRRNKSFTEAPIVPGYMQNLSPKLQYDEKTSAPSIALGKAINASPKKIDYLLNSYTGVMGDIGIPATSKGTGKSALGRVGDVLKQTYISDPLYSNDILSRFYDEKARLATAKADTAATGTMAEGYIPELTTYFNSQSNDIGDLSKISRQINKDPKLSPEYKEGINRAIQERRLQIALEALSLAEMAKKKSK